MEILLIMCPQNSYLDPKGSVYLGEKAENLKIRIIDYLSDFNGKKVFFREKHAEADNFFITGKTHSLVNSFDFNVAESLRKHATLCYDKSRYSGFYKTNFEAMLKRDKVTSIVIAGLETHTSVLFTAEEARNRGLNVSIIEPLVASMDDFMHDNALSLMVNYLGVQIRG